MYCAENHIYHKDDMYVGGIEEHELLKHDTLTLAPKHARKFNYIFQMQMSKMHSIIQDFSIYTESKINSIFQMS